MVYKGRTFDFEGIAHLHFKVDLHLIGNNWFYSIMTIEDKSGLYI